MTLVEQFAARRCTTPEELASEPTRSLDALAVGESSTVVGFEGDDVVVTVHAPPPDYREAREAPRIALSIAWSWLS